MGKGITFRKKEFFIKSKKDFLMRYKCPECSREADYIDGYFYDSIYCPFCLNCATIPTFRASYYEHLRSKEKEEINKIKFDLIKEKMVRGE